MVSFVFQQLLLVQWVVCSVESAVSLWWCHPASGRAQQAGVLHGFDCTEGKGHFQAVRKAHLGPLVHIHVALVGGHKFLDRPFLDPSQGAGVHNPMVPGVLGPMAPGPCNPAVDQTMVQVRVHVVQQVRQVR